jgi:hypothetical protein
LSRFEPNPIYPYMNKHPLAAAGLSLALTGIASSEAVSPQAEPPEAHCQTVAPCTVPQFVPLPTDGPESNSEATAPPAAGTVAASGASANSLPPLGWLDDGTMARRHHVPRRPITKAVDDGWLGATVVSVPSLGWMNDTTMPLRRPSLARRAAAIHSSDDGWMQYAATQTQPAPAQ